METQISTDTEVVRQGHTFVIPLARQCKSTHNASAPLAYDITPSNSWKTHSKSLQGREFVEPPGAQSYEDACHGREKI